MKKVLFAGVCMSLLFVFCSVSFGGDSSRSGTITLTVGNWAYDFAGTNDAQHQIAIINRGDNPIKCYIEFYVLDNSGEKSVVGARIPPNDNDYLIIPAHWAKRIITNDNPDLANTSARNHDSLPVISWKGKVDVLPVCFSEARIFNGEQFTAISSGVAYDDTTR